MIDHRADVYSLAVTLYELLTLHPAFAAEDRHLLLKQIAFEEPTSLRRIDRDIPSELEIIIQKAMSKDMDDRYASAEELADDLRRFLDNRPIKAKAPTLVQVMGKWTRRNPIIALASVVTLLLTTITFGVSAVAIALEKKETDRQYARATEQLRVSKATRLAAQSQALTQSSPVVSALLAVEAVRTTRRHDGTVLPVARETLMAATSELGGVPLVGHTHPIRSVSTSADGRWLVTRGVDGPRLWDLTSTDWPIASRVLPHAGTWQAAISPDQRWIVTGSRDGTVRLWDFDGADPADASIELVNYPQRKGVRNLVISDNSRWAVASCYDGLVQAWDLTAKDPKSATRVFQRHSRPIYGGAVDVSADGRWLATGSLDETALIWDLNAEDQTTPQHEFVLGDSVTQVAISPDGRWLVTVSDRPRLWDLEADEPTKSAIPLRQQIKVHSVVITRDSRLLALANGDGTACLYDLSTEDPAASCIVMRGHQGAVNRIAISDDRDHNWLATGGAADHTVRLWNLHAVNRDSLPTATNHEGHDVKLWSADDTPGSTHLLTGHDGAVWAMAIASDNKRLITGDWEGNVRLWNLDADNPAANRVVDAPNVQTVGVSPDGKWLVVGCRGDASRLWELDRSGRLTSSVKLHGATDGIGTFVISSDSRWLITTSAVPIFVDEANHARNEDVAHVWDLKASDPGQQAIELRGHQGAVTSIAISEGNLVATGSTDHTVRLWDLSTERGKLVHDLKGHDDRVLSVAITPDGTRLASGGNGGTTFLWELSKDSVRKQELRAHEMHIIAIAISPDGRWVAAGGSYGSSYVWDLQSPGRLTRRTIPEHNTSDDSFVTGLAFSRDNRWLATGSWDSKTIVWDLSREDPFSSPHLLLQNDHGVHSVAFSPDSRLVISGSYVIPRVLDVTNPNQVALALPEQTNSAVALTPDGRRAVTGDGHTVRLWDLEIESLLKYAKQLVGRELTAQERKRFSISDD